MHFAPLFVRPAQVRAPLSASCLTVEAAGAGEGATTGVASAGLLVGTTGAGAWTGGATGTNAASLVFFGGALAGLASAPCLTVAVMLSTQPASLLAHSRCG